MKSLVITLTGITATATLATVILWLFDQRVAGAIVGSMTLFLYLGLLVTATVIVTSWWSANLMERGAQLALRSQESDDKRDIALVKTLARRDQVALPLPTQSTWLPELAEYEVDHDPGHTL